jgi:preprotein translocase subunit SecB
MRASVIQLKQIVFQRIEVEAIEPTEDKEIGEAPGFDFEGTAFRVALDSVAAPGDHEGEARSFWIMLGISIDPSEGKQAPYKVDVSALGLVEVSDSVEQEKRRDLALVNGASLVYGAIRELVTTLTARCVAGPLVLPTVDFRDHSQVLVPEPSNGKDS